MRPFIFLSDFDVRRMLNILFGVLLTFSVVVGFGAPAFAARKSAAAAIDAHTGKILYSYNIDKPHHPASLTKIMTIYVLFEFLQSGRLSLDSELVVTQNAANQQPSKLGLKPGSRIKVEDAIKALITKSANDVAVTVAENLAGSEWKFAKLMTWKARKMGMSKTRFVNASGLPNKKQTTTARDMITLSQRIQKDFPQYYPFFATKRFAYHGKKYKSYNRLLFKMKGIDGIKTGYTRASGFNLTSSVWKGRKHVVAVVLGGKTSRRRDNYMMRLLRKSLRRASNGPRKRHMMIARRPKIKQKPQQKWQPKRVAEQPKRKAQKPLVVASTHKKSPDQIRRLGATPIVSGPYHIQIGAFGSKGDAQERLSLIGSKAKSLLAGHKSFTMAVPESSVFRARFAGFAEDQARRICAQLKKRSIDCLAVPAQ